MARRNTIAAWYNQISSTIKICPGLSFVESPGHGGLRITEAKAKLWGISPEAIKYGAIRQGTYYYFEEDCNADILIWELPYVQVRMLHKRVYPNIGIIELRKSAKTSIFVWNMRYAIAHKMDYTLAQYSKWWEREASYTYSQKRITHTETNAIHYVDAVKPKPVVSINDMQYHISPQTGRAWYTLYIAEWLQTFQHEDILELCKLVANAGATVTF